MLNGLVCSSPLREDIGQQYMQNMKEEMFQSGLVGMQRRANMADMYLGRNHGPTPGVQKIPGFDWTGWAACGATSEAESEACRLQKIPLR